MNKLYITKLFMIILTKMKRCLREGRPPVTHTGIFSEVVKTTCAKCLPYYGSQEAAEAQSVLLRVSTFTNFH